MSTLQSHISRHAPSWPAALARSALPLAVIAVLATLMHTLLAPAVGPFVTNVLCNTGIAIMLAVSLNVVNGFTGQFSIGHAGFMAVGGYAGGIITYYGSLLLFGSPAAQEGLFTTGSLLFLGGCLLGGLVAAAVGYFVGLPALRLRGDYLAIVTLGFGEIVRVLLTQTGDVLFTADEVREAGVLKTVTSVGGALGFGGVPWYNNLFWTTLIGGIMLLICYRLKQGSTGRAFLSVREDEIAAQAMGINIAQIKVRAFVISAAMAGVAGVVFAHQPGVALNPNELNFNRSFEILIAVVLGGLGSISGTALAAIIVTILSETLKDPPTVILWGLAAIALSLGLAITRHFGERRATGAALGALIGGVLAAVLLAAAALKYGEGLRASMNAIVPAPAAGAASAAPVGLWIAALLLTTLAVLGAAKWKTARAGVAVRCIKIALIGAIIVAAVEAWRLLAGALGVDLGAYRMILYALMLILMMLLRPQGLLGIHELWDAGRLLRPARAGKGAKA